MLTPSSGSVLPLFSFSELQAKFLLAVQKLQKKPNAIFHYNEFPLPQFLKYFNCEIITKRWKVAGILMPQFMHRLVCSGFETQ
jgi:hypothetical protein